MSDGIAIGVAGAGVFGGHHAGKYAGMKSAAVRGIYDIDQDRARQAASARGAEPFSDYDALVSAVDAVVIASPATTHYELARAALEAGRHVFVEKPLALRAEDAEALVALAEKQGLVLRTGHQERYVAAAIGLFELEDRPLTIDCIRCAAPSDRCRDVSVVFDLMIHDFDLVRQLTKSAPQRVRAEGGYDEARAEFLLESGTLATFRASRAAEALERRMRLVYEQGFIEIDFLERSVVNTTKAAMSGDFNAPDNSDGRSERALAFADPLGLGAVKFIAAITAGGGEAAGAPSRAFDHVTGRDGADAVSWACAVEGAVLSAEGGKAPDRAAGEATRGTTLTEERLQA